MAPLVRARIGIYDKAMRAIGEHTERIIVRGVDKPGLIKRYARPEHPHSVALQHTLERVDGFADSREQPVLVIADEVSEQARHREELWSYQREGTPGYRPTKLGQVIDTIHFAPSHASRLVQSADLVAYMYRRRNGHVETDERSRRANDRIWSHVSASCRDSGCWYPERTRTPRR